MLLDTSGLLSALDVSEFHHSAAVRLYDEAPIRIPHNYVLAELVALCSARRLPRQASLTFIAEVAADADVDLHWVDPVLHSEAMQLLTTQLDKRYSLCDAVSIILMQRFGILDALTTDHHFEQAGFRRLLSD